MPQNHSITISFAEHTTNRAGAGTVSVHPRATGSGFRATMAARLLRSLAASRVGTGCSVALRPVPLRPVAQRSSALSSLRCVCVETAGVRCVSAGHPHRPRPFAFCRDDARAALSGFAASVKRARAERVSRSISARLAPPVGAVD